MADVALLEALEQRDFGSRGTCREASLEGNVLKLWSGDQRYHFRREGTFHRRPERR